MGASAPGPAPAAPSGGAATSPELIGPETLTEAAPTYIVEDGLAWDGAPLAQPVPDGWLWGRAEYLHWWTDGFQSPQLVTTSPAGTAQTQAGVLGAAGTTTIFGGDLEDNGRSGGRFTLGMWLDPGRNLGLEISYLMLDDTNVEFHSAPTGLPIVARPFFNASTSANDSRLIAFPGLVGGTLDVVASSEFSTWEVLLRRTAALGYGSRVDYLLGYRGSRLNDRFRFDESSISLSGATAGATLVLFDQFDVENRFHGAEIGFAWYLENSDISSWEVLGKFAFGATNTQAMLAAGTTTTTVGGLTTTTPNGALVQPTNSGNFTQNDFSAMLELGLTYRRELRCGLVATVGYSFLYWSDVTRGGDIIDTTLNPTQIPPGTLMGAARPAFQFNTGDFTAHGLHIGLEYNF